MSKNKKEGKRRSPWQLWKGLSKKKKQLAGVIAGFSVLVLAAGYTVFIAPLLEQEEWVYKETTVERGTLTVGVSESGSLEYGISTILYELDLDFSDEDDEDEEETVLKYLEVEEVYIAAGQRVAEGDAILKFTDDSVKRVRKLLQTALVDAQVAYNEAEATYNLSVLEAKIDYDTQKVNESYASSIYSASSSSIENDISAMQVELSQRTANIASLQEKLENAQEEYEEAYETYVEKKEAMDQINTDHAPNFMTIQSLYLSAQSKYQSAESALEKAQQNLTENEEQLESLNRQIAAAQERKAIDKLDANQSYEESRISGENAQITYNAQLESLKETLQESEDDKKAVADQMDAFEVFVGSDGILYSDGSGIVTALAYEAGDSLITAGTVMSYATAGSMTISVDVTQEDIVALAVGDVVDILFSAYKDAPYQGTILSIDTTATSQSSATVSYSVVIGVEGDTELLYGGMTADITFVTEEKEDVLYISKKAIIEENDKTFVYVKTALGGMELAQVETGVGNSVSIEILSGLEEGDTVYIASKVSSEAAVEETSDVNSDSSNENAAAEGSEAMPGAGGMENGGFGGGMQDFGGSMPDFGGMEARP